MNAISQHDLAFQEIFQKFSGCLQLVAFFKSGNTSFQLTRYSLYVDGDVYHIGDEQAFIVA